MDLEYIEGIVFPSMSLFCSLIVEKKKGYPVKMIFFDFLQKKLSASTRENTESITNEKLRLLVVLKTSQIL